MTEQRIVVGFESALSFWRGARVGAAECPEETPEGRVYGVGSPDLADRARVALGQCGADSPLEVVIPDRSGRHGCELICDHVWKGPLSSAHLHGLGGDISVCRPAAVFSQMATVLDQIELLELAFELTGAYGLSPGSEEGFEGGMRPLATVEELVEYASAARALGARGARSALEALELVVPGSKSPRETDVAIFLEFGRVRGGADLGGFRLNERVRLPEPLARKMGQLSIEPDFSWPNGTVVEYDSEVWHRSAERRAHDEAKRRAYKSVGMDCLTLTKGMVADEFLLEGFVEDLTASLGIRRRPASPQMLAARQDLLARLFGHGAHRGDASLCN